MSGVKATDRLRAALAAYHAALGLGGRPLLADSPVERYLSGLAEGGSRNGMRRSLFLAAKLLDANQYRRLAGVLVSCPPSPRSPSEVALADVAALFRVCERDITSATGARDAAAIALMFYAKLRRAEVARLTLDEFGRANGMSRVMGASGDIQIDVGSDAYAITSKAGNNLVVNLQALFRRTVIRRPATSDADDKLLRYVRAWLRWRGGWPGPLLTRVGKRGFPLRQGLTAQALMKRVHFRSSQAGIKRVSPEALRREFDYGASG